MPVLETSGGRLVAASGRATSFSRPFAPSLGSGSVNLAGDRTISFANIYRTQAWVAINVNKLTRQIARLPLKAYKVNDEGHREEVLRGPLADLLAKPWERGSALNLKQALTFPTALHGNALLAKMRRERGGPPTAFLPLDWRFLTPHLDTRGGIMFWETRQTGKPLFVDPADVVHVAWEAPDGDIGVSPLQQLGVTLRLEDAAQQYATSSFDNAARPAGALVYDKDAQVKPEEREELRSQIEQTHGGVHNAFKLLLLGGGIDWKAFSQTAKEAQLIEARKLNREEVAAVYDFPGPLVGILEHATFSNVTEQHKMLYGPILGPWLTLIEEVLQAQLIDPEPTFAGHVVGFDVDEQLRGDAEKRIPALTKGIESGLYTINEARKREGLPEIEHPLANVPLVPTNNLSVLGADQETGGGNALAANLGRARDRILSRVGAGAEAPFDVERFERELAADVGDEVLARNWARLIDQSVEEIGPDPDPDRIKRFFSALSA
jgi:HK97 family phage portal protein